MTDTRIGDATTTIFVTFFFFLSFHLFVSDAQGNRSIALLLIRCRG